MKEFTIEQKARRYDEAIERANSLLSSNQLGNAWIYKLLPELKESEDEGMVKFIKQQLFNIKKTITENYELDAKLTTAIAWLEKQGRYKPTDKVEQKFHEGEWVVYECGEETATLQITRIVGETYVFSDDSTLGVVDEDTLRLWDITKDAKDGDVLCAKNSCPFIYDKDRYNNGLAYYYVGIDVSGNLNIKSPHNMLTHFGRLDDIRPATKEQRDFLFQKMKEAGYEWDAERKESKKIDDEEFNGEDYGIDSLYHAQRILEKTLGKVEGYQTDDGILSHQCAISAVKKLYEQNPWSEEDEKMFECALNMIEWYGGVDEDKSKPVSDWLKSLKDRYTWKPSKEQMNTLDQWLKDNQYKGDARYCYPIINSLYQDLKKLMEE